MPEPQRETFEDVVGGGAATTGAQKVLPAAVGQPIYLSKFVGKTRADVEKELQDPKVKRLLQAQDVRVTFKAVQGSVGPNTVDKVVDQDPPPDDDGDFTEVYPGTTITLSYLEGEPDEALAQQVLKKLDDFDAAAKDRFEQLMQAIQAIGGGTPPSSGGTQSSGTSSSGAKGQQSSTASTASQAQQTPKP
ncbi:hypothetical protein DAERI_180014 [Deinococcus aerius]|uniref:Uncharacterized protein n=1 Tax=Deinococcus aerius TaxID=200253 RepID=A0A2I9CZY1_9DEIO|nr:hypothetical protein [Deinococcus aerius]GBF07823.1 hypothetical protein DAERI_180014 [Deinococcus aerius]